MKSCMKIDKACLMLLLLLTSFNLMSQKVVVMEQARFVEYNHPVKTYLLDSAIQHTIASQLNQTLLKNQGLTLKDTVNFPVTFVTPGADIKSIRPNYLDPDTTHLHLYIDFLEVMPQGFFSLSENYPPDSNLVKRTNTVFMIVAWLLDSKKNVVYTEKLNLIISTGDSPGMGTYYAGSIKYNDLTVVPRVFTGMIKSGTSILFDLNNDLSTVELKLIPGYTMDNYIFPKTYNKPRIFIANNKNIFSYNYQANSEVFRLGDPVYEEIRIKGKKAEKYPDDLTAAIKKTVHYSNSDFVYLRQECRDVINDKNYLLKLTTQVDPENLQDGQQFLFTNFLEGKFHYLFLEKDTLAQFTIEKDVTDLKNQYYPYMITNGYDSVSMYKFPSARTSGWNVFYNYVVKGDLNHQAFTIKCSGARNSVKELFLGDKLVCIAQGKFSPEKFVVFDASLSTQILNQLFMIGFNRFFE